jgi:hypothetical protein
MAFDTERGRTVLFGGSSVGWGTLGDTWEWDGSTWTQVEAVGPSVRSGHAMAFDSDQQRTLLFGGLDSGGVATGDTWQWDGTTWTQVADTGPPARQLHGLVYATDRKRTVLFGGLKSEPPFFAPTLAGDTWEWDGSQWTQGEDGPARQGVAMAFTGASTVFFGGLQSGFDGVASDTWQWDGSHWEGRLNTGPLARWLSAMAFDSARNRLVLFGGTTQEARDTQLGDYWESAVPEWDPVPEVVLTSFEVDHVFGFPIEGSLVLSGPAPSPGLVVQISVDGGSTALPLNVGSTTIAGPSPWSVPISVGSSGFGFSINEPIIVGSWGFKATLGSITMTAQT